MISRPRTLATILGFTVLCTSLARAEEHGKRIVFVAGTRSHGYGAHEHNAGCLLLAKYLKQAMPTYTCEVHQNGWPQQGVEAFEGADAVVVYCDGGGRHLLNPHLDPFDAVMKKGVGLACLHYGVEVPKGKAGNAFLDWMGGYFETNWSVNPHWTAKYESFPDHPVANGVQPFEINDEWYFHMRFRENMKGVTPILSAIPPKETMSRSDGPHSGNPHVRRAVAAREPQHMAWVAERPDGGRGFGFTGGHVHWNWGDDNFRKVVLNAIVWIAGGEVPESGVSTKTPTRTDLEANQDFPKKAARLGAKTKYVAALATDQQDRSHDPAKAIANLDVHPQLEAQLFAYEPMLLSPSNVDVDHRGRIWVCEIVNYRDFANPNNPVREKGDRILILEDTDQDGSVDKQTVFYQGRDIDSPHGICVLGERVIVSAKGQVVAFLDTNGDDKPDGKEVMYTGIGGANHDHGIHAFMFAPDGKLYFNFGNSGQQLLTADGQPIVDASGKLIRADRSPYQEGMVFRQNLDGSGIETLGWNFRNNWMVTVDSYGAIWQSDNDDDGNRGVRINFVMEFGNYGYKDELTGAGWRTDRTGMSELPAKHWYQNDPGVVPNLLHTGAGSPTGITVYEGDLLPEIFQGQLIHCDAGPSVARAYIVSEDGAGFRARIENILEGTRDQWFRPSDVKVAPDGSLIVADWYDPGVGGHRMGDVNRGRIFRVIPKGNDGRYIVPPFDFDTPAGAAQALRNPNYATRYLAWTALHKMGAKAEPALLELWEDSNPRIRARALWLLGKIEGRGLHYVDIASRDHDKNIRCTAVRLARQLPDVDVLPLVTRLASDPSAAVRRECAIALRHNQADEVATLWARLASQHDGKDRWYLEALGIAADGKWDRFMEAWLKLVDGKWNTPAGRDLVWRSRSTKTAGWLGQVIGDLSVKNNQLPRYFRAMDFLSEEDRHALAMQLAFGRVTGDTERSKLIKLESARRVDPASVRGNAAYLSVLNSMLDDLVGTKDFVDFTIQFDLQDRYPQLLEVATQQPGSQIATEAIAALLQNGQEPLIRQLLSGNDVEAISNVIQAVGLAGMNSGSRLMMEVIASPSADLEVRRNAVRAAARSREGVSWLLKRVEQDKLEPELTESVAAELSRSPSQAVRRRAAELLPLPPTKEAEPLPSIGVLASATGDAANGKKLFAGQGTCSKCHVVNNQGKEVGPNLSEIGSKLSKEAMFESILYPSAGISHNYEAYSLVTVDGNAVTGLLISATDQHVVITSEDGIARTFQRGNIELLEKQTISLMPADLQKLMTKQELIDVVEYMMTLKKQ